MSKPEPSWRVLDVCCGTGDALAEYAGAGCAVTGIDRSPAMLERAGKKLNGRADLVLGDATAMPFDSDSFDLALITLALHEMDPEVREAVLGEIARVLNPSGRLLIIDYHAGAPEGLYGRFARGVLFVIERMVGGDHYRNYRRFQASGGLPPLLDGRGYAVEKTRFLTGGNLAVVLSRPPAV
ncbi:MAG: methyltransferase domain-containing protein [Deltaproteobacteria bacterium]|nr:methyltransferase domain-containing protein [Deltaproteobacteria bacterium]